MKLGNVLNKLFIVVGFSIAGISYSQNAEKSGGGWVLLNPNELECGTGAIGQSCTLSQKNGSGIELFKSHGEGAENLARKNQAVLVSAKAQNKAVLFNPNTGEIIVSSTPMAEVTDKIATLGARLAACEAKLNQNEKTLNPDQLKAIEKAIVNSMSKAENSSESKKGH